MLRTCAAAATLQERGGANVLSNYKSTRELLSPLSSLSNVESLTVILTIMLAVYLHAQPQPAQVKLENHRAPAYY